MTKSALALLALCGLAAVACERQAQARSARPDSMTSAPAGIIDSILPPGEALRRFQANLAPVTELSASIRSRDTLVARFTSAIESGDSAALKSLLVSKDEYAFLYFPTSAYSRKPYELPPEIAWLLSEQNSIKGFTRLARRLGMKRLGLRGYECADPVTEGTNRFWRACRVTYIDPANGFPVTKALFGAIMERDGRYKFLSYANDF